MPQCWMQRAKHQQACTHTCRPFLLCVCVDVCCLCAFMSFPLLSPGHCQSPGGQEKKTNMVWCGRIFSHQRIEKGKIKGKESLKKEKQPESEMQNVIASSITFKSGLKSQFFPLPCFIHGGLLSLMSFTQPQWGIIGWGIGLWDTVLCNHRDLSPFYKLLSFCNSCLQLLPLPSRSEGDWLTATLLWLPPRSVATGKFTADSCSSGERICAAVCARARVRAGAHKRLRTLTCTLAYTMVTRDGHVSTRRWTSSSLWLMKGAALWKMAK